MKIFRILFSVLLFVFILDSLFFRILIWILPNESPWGTNHFFNFEYEVKKIRSKKSPNPRILILGSSIAYYSIDRKMLESYLKQKTGKDYDVEYFSYAGMTPLDAYLCSDLIRELNPSLIVFPINFIDYRIHRNYAIDPSSLNKSSERDLILDALNFGEAPQSRFSFPYFALKEFFEILSFEKNAEYLSASIFGFYRYREIYFANLKNLYNHRFGRNTSYHGYAGIQIPERVNSLGWTAKKFTFTPTKKMGEEGFYIQIVPEILQQGKLFLFVTNQQGDSQQLEFSKSGWVNVRIVKKFFDAKSPVTITLSNTWKPNEAKEDRFDHSRDDTGVRLSQTFGLDEPLSDMQYVREERIEDLRFINMSDADYRKYFYYRLLDDYANRPGIAYLHALKNAKEKVAKEKFFPTLQLKYLKKFSESMAKDKKSVIIFNNPENPISLEWYVHSEWYRDHLEFLRSLSTSTISFFDFKNNLKMQDFSDFHHITYPAMNKLNSIYGDRIIEASHEK